MLKLKLNLFISKCTTYFVCTHCLWLMHFVVDRTPMTCCFSLPLVIVGQCFQRRFVVFVCVCMTMTFYSCQSLFACCQHLSTSWLEFMIAESFDQSSLWGEADQAKVQVSEARPATLKPQRWGGARSLLTSEVRWGQAVRPREPSKGGKC